MYILSKSINNSITHVYMHLPIDTRLECPHVTLLLIKSRISVHLRHLTWIMPVQDLPKTLKCLLDVLVDPLSTSPTHVDISVNKQLIAESPPQQLNRLPDQSTDSNIVKTWYIMLTLY